MVSRTSSPAPAGIFSCCTGSEQQRSPRLSSSTCLLGGSLPSGVEQRPDDRGALDPARVCVNPTVVHRILGDLVELLWLHADITQPRRKSETRHPLRDEV